MSRIKVKDLVVGESYEGLEFLVKESSIRLTKANKNYLNAELFDGSMPIKAIAWNWVSEGKPASNDVVTVDASVEEYQGNKQLKITRIVHNIDVDPDEFSPTNDRDLASVYSAFYELATDITDDFLSNLIKSILEETSILWRTCPGAKTMHHAFVGGNLVHSLSVACIAKATAMQIPDASIDLAVAGAMLHDIGKLFTYNMHGAIIDMSLEGMMYDHLFIGAEFVGNFADNHELLKSEEDEAKLMLLRHIILSHHGEQEKGAVTLPMCIEARIVHHADAVDAEVQMTLEADINTTDEGPLTVKAYGLSNRPQIKPSYIYNNIFRNII